MNFSGAGATYSDQHFYFVQGSGVPVGFFNIEWTRKVTANRCKRHTRGAGWESCSNLECIESREVHSTTIPRHAGSVLFMDKFINGSEHSCRGTGSYRLPEVDKHYQLLLDSASPEELVGLLSIRHGSKTTVASANTSIVFVCPAKATSPAAAAALVKAAVAPINVEELIPTFTDKVPVAMRERMFRHLEKGNDKFPAFRFKYVGKEGKVQAYPTQSFGTGVYGRSPEGAIVNAAAAAPTSNAAIVQLHAQFPTGRYHLYGNGRSMELHHDAASNKSLDPAAEGAKKKQKR